MLKNRRLLPLLLLLVAGLFQPLMAGTSAPPVERSELPMIMASVYDHWEKDLQPLAISQTTTRSVTSIESRSESMPYILLSVLFIAVGVLVIGDAARVGSTPLLPHPSRSAGEH